MRAMPTKRRISKTQSGSMHQIDKVGEEKATYRGPIKTGMLRSKSSSIL